MLRRALRHRSALEPTLGNGARAPMPPTLRLTVFTVGALLWVSGVLWLIVHVFLVQQGPWGALPNGWEPALLRLHGLLAVGGVFLLGWLAAAHLSWRWRSGARRYSGLLLAGSAVLLVVSGYALYYTTGALHGAASWVHECLGAAAVLAALPHWWRGRSSSP
jgi:hypothetical protein